MSQFDPGIIDPEETSGSALAASLMQWRDALHSDHMGSSPPAYAVGGMRWLDSATTGYLFEKRYTGSAWVTTGRVKLADNSYVPYFGTAPIDFGDMKKSQNLAGLQDKAQARSNLGLGSAAEHSVDDFAPKTDLDLLPGIAKAWVHFTGVGTVAVRRSHNVSSIVDNGVGIYRINFLKPMADEFSCVQYTTSNSGNNGSAADFVAAMSADYVEVRSYRNNGQSGQYVDVVFGMVTVHGDLAP